MIQRCAICSAEVDVSHLQEHDHWHRRWGGSFVAMEERLRLMETLLVKVFIGEEKIDVSELDQLLDGREELFQKRVEGPPL